MAKRHQGLWTPSPEAGAAPGCGTVFPSLRTKQPVRSADGLREKPRTKRPKRSASEATPFFRCNRLQRRKLPHGAGFTARHAYHQPSLESLWSLSPRCERLSRPRSRSWIGQGPSVSTSRGWRWSDDCLIEQSGGWCPKRERRGLRPRYGRPGASELKTGRRRHHWCSARVNGRDDLLDVDPL
jgi:hypothetical protein